ncbi:MAG TPA: ABC transporter permease [Dehalococcoidia bacterium]|jgi:NitT/TauT family transport system permease protein|nr:ABC transporter permease [Dehalococcoidia bacterium]
MRFNDFDFAGLILKALRISAFFAALLGLWQLLYDLHIWSPYLLPEPVKVWHSLEHYVDNGQLWRATKASMQRLLIGYAISILIGLIIGMLCGLNKYADETLGSIVLGLQSLPSICWLPLAVLWFGLNENAIIFVVAMGSIFAIAISARAGVQGIPPLYRRAAATMGANRFQLIFWVLLPAMVPAMAQGLKLGWSFAWRSLMSAELIPTGTAIGLGQTLTFARDLNDMSSVIAIMLAIVALGIATDRLFFSRMEAWANERWGLLATT